MYFKEIYIDKHRLECFYNDIRMWLFLRRVTYHGWDLSVDDGNQDIYGMYMKEPKFYVL